MLGKSTVDKWSRQLRQERNGQLSSSSAMPLTPDQIKIRELERKIKRLEGDNDILKKASAVSPQRLRLMAELKWWFNLSRGSAGQRSLMTLLARSGFSASLWLVRKRMKQAALVSRQQPTHRYAKRFGMR